MRLHLLAGQRGFSAVETLLVVGIVGLMSAMAVVQVGVARPALRGDSAMRAVMAQMRTARELAISERRYMRVTFTGTNRIEIVREDVPGPSTTIVGSTQLEGEVGYHVIDDVPDTPDAFGRGTPINFGTASTVKFTPDGTLVNQNGSTVNGSVFLAIPHATLSARAVTVLGATGRIRGYRWDGRNWKRV